MHTVKIINGLNEDARFIREEVFVKEQGFKVEFDDIDNSSYHIVIYKEGIAVATGRLYKKSNDSKIYILGRIAVRKAYRKMRFGETVIKNLEKMAKELNAEKVQLSAQLRVKNFYEKLNYTPVGKEYLDENCPHILMEKSLQ